MPYTALTKRASRQSRVESLQNPSQNNEETLDTLSTAALPPAYTITLARPAGDEHLVDEKIAEEYRRGQEYLNDGVRRVKDKEGDLGDLIKARKRRRQSLGKASDGGSAALDKDVLWYTASLCYACSCDLQPLSRSLKLRRPPPSRDDLTDLPPTIDAAEVVYVGEDLPEWADKKDYTDLDPTLDTLREFESDWRNATGDMWESQGIGKFCDAFESDVEEAEAEADVGAAGVVAVLETPEGRWLRKGKFKAIDPLNLGQHPLRHEIPDTPVPMQLQDVVLDTPYPPARVGKVVRQPVEMSQQEKMDWEQESKRRKQLWRGVVGNDPGYGQFWEALARPHSYANLGAVPDQARPPDYNLFRNYLTAVHPYHPDLSRYISKNPYGRVYWLIPIHGPVIVPDHNDEAIKPTYRPTEGSIPTPSSATFQSDSSIAPAIPGKVSRPARIDWTSTLLNHFVQSFLLPLRQSRLYGLSIAFSGPKPDPFIALKPPAPLFKHSHAGKSHSRKDESADKAINITAHTQRDKPQPDADRRPARVEAGDHVRVYCDAEEALSLRTWLHGIHVDVDYPGAERPGGGSKGAKGRRLFDKVRLTLIGQSGEVLIVA